MFYRTDYREQNCKPFKTHIKVIILKLYFDFLFVENKSPDKV